MGIVIIRYRFQASVWTAMISVSLPSTGEGDGEQRAGDKRGEEIKQEPRRSMGRNAVRAFVVQALSHNRMVLVLVSNQRVSPPYTLQTGRRSDSGVD